MIKLISDVYDQVITFTKVTKNLKNMDCGDLLTVGMKQHTKNDLQLSILNQYIEESCFYSHSLFEEKSNKYFKVEHLQEETQLLLAIVDFEDLMTVAALSKKLNDEYYVLEYLQKQLQYKTISERSIKLLIENLKLVAFKTFEEINCGGNIAIISERSRYLFTPLFFSI